MSLLQMSFFGTVMILAVVVLRTFGIHKLPKKVFLILWEIALIRLLVPFSISTVFSVYSLINRNAPAPIPEVFTGIPVGNTTMPQIDPVPPAIYESTNQVVQNDVLQSEVMHSGMSDISVWFIIWMVGVLICACYFFMAYLRCRSEFQVSLPVGNAFVDEWLKEHPLKRSVKIRQSGRISAPLTYGVLHPVILMPKDTDWENRQQLQFVFMHEYIHILRFDTGRKLIATLALCIHWFNPFVWAMYILYNRDIELVCDESVVLQFGNHSKWTYARTLISMEETKSKLRPLCNNFSRNAIEERIKAIMKTKTMTRSLLLVSTVVIVVIAALFATSAEEVPASNDTEKETEELTDRLTQESDAVVEPTTEETRAEFIMMQFEDQIRETRANLYKGNGFSIYVPENWSMYDEYLTAPVKFTVQVGYECSVWIEQYEDEAFSDVEKRFLSDGFGYDTDKENLRKADGTLLTEVRLEAKAGDVWAVFRMYNEAYEDSYRVDVVADTCVITGTTGDGSEETKQEAIYIDDAYYDSHAQYLKEMDWNHIGRRITEEEYQTLQIYLPVLKGEEFTWIYRSGEGEEPDTYMHNKKQVTIREMLAAQLGVHGIKAVEPLVDSICFADVFQSGSESMILLLRNQAWSWLILHEEDGVIYGIDMPVRWFGEVQKDGLYVGSSEADTLYYHRMQFINRDYTEELVGTVIRDELIIDGVKKSDAEYEAWKKQNLKEAAKVYTPLEKNDVEK